MPYRQLSQFLIAGLALVLGCTALGAQVLQPVKWAFSTEVADGKTYLVHEATIAEGWTVYSQYLPSDDGPVATEIVYEEMSGAKALARGVESGGRIAGFDDIFQMEVVKFKKGYVIRQEVSGFTGQPIRGYLTFMSCDKTQCLPPSDVEFVFNAPQVTKAPAPPAVKPAAPNSQGRVEGLSPKPSTPAPKVLQPSTSVASTKDDAESTTAASGPIQSPAEPRPRPSQSEPVVWHFETRALDDSTYVLTAVATIAEGWNIYAQDSNDEGPVPTSFSFDESPDYRLVGGVTEKGKRKKGLDPTFGVQVSKLYGPEVRFEQNVVLSDPEARIEGYLEFMSCDQEQCLPPRDVNFAYAPAAGIAQEGLFAAVAEQTPETPAAAEVDADGDPLSGYRIDKDNQGATCGNADFAEVNVSSKDGSLVVFFLGFGGGLLALLTPCVFPMIPLTVSFFTGRGKDKKRGFRRALLYGASIITIYVGLGLLITSIFGADALNAFSTDPWVNIAFAVLFVIFALSFFGLFEINLPSSWANKSDRAADQGGFLGIFFMAFTLSLVSFSCTGPIIGTLLVETASGGGRTLFGHIPVAPLVGMLGFSTALALPFTMFALFPSALASLPKSGGWMSKVKVTLGILEIAFAMKFLSTADLILDTKWMPYELFIGIWVVCAVVLALYYYSFGDLRNDIASGDKRWSRTNLGFSLIAVALAVYIGLGYRYDEQTRTFQTPNALSGLAPPAGHSYIYPKDCPRDFDCFKDYDEGLAYAREVNKPILLDFTGHGCVNCRRMEDQVWGQPGVHERIKEDYVLISLYVDEREELAEPFVSDFSGRKLRTVGNKWADFQARFFDRNSQPYYVLLDPQGSMLNQPVPYTPDVEEYAAFLDCGLQQFERLTGKGALGSVE